MAAAACPPSSGDAFPGSGNKAASATSCFCQRGPTFPARASPKASRATQAVLVEAYTSPLCRAGAKHGEREATHQDSSTLQLAAHACTCSAPLPVMSPPTRTAALPGARMKRCGPSRSTAKRPSTLSTSATKHATAF